MQLVLIICISTQLQTMRCTEDLKKNIVMDDNRALWPSLDDVRRYFVSWIQSGDQEKKKKIEPEKTSAKY